MIFVKGVSDGGLTSQSHWDELLSDEAVHWVCGWPAFHWPRSGQGTVIYEKIDVKLLLKYLKYFTIDQLHLSISRYYLSCKMFRKLTYRSSFIQGLPSRKSIWLHGIHFTWGENQLLWKTCCGVSAVWRYVKYVRLWIHSGCRFLKYRFTTVTNVFIFLVLSYVQKKTVTMLSQC